MHKSFQSYVAQVVEIARGAAGAVRIERVTCAVDCGVALNPDIVKAQMEGGIGYGLGHVMRNAITFDNGEVVQQNFPDYEPLRISDIGRIDVHIVPSAEPPTGVGVGGRAIGRTGARQRDCGGRSAGDRAADGGKRDRLRLIRSPGPGSGSSPVQLEERNIHGAGDGAHPPVVAGERDGLTVIGQVRA